MSGDDATDRLVAHLDHGECYAGNCRDEDFGLALMAVFEAAHSLIGVTTHANVTGEHYQDRKSGYAFLRRTLLDPRLAPLNAALGLPNEALR